MKKILAMTMLLCISMVAMATAQMKAYAPDFEQDIGCVISQDTPLMAATLSVDGMTVVAFDSQMNIVDWQTTTKTIVSAQCVDAYTVQTADGSTVGVALYALRCPNVKPECMNYRTDYTYNVPQSRCNNSFTTAHTDNC